MRPSYDENYLIRFTYSLGSQPTLKLLITNPLNNKKVLIEDAVVDSGADCTTAPSFIGKIQLLHNIKNVKRGTDIVPSVGIGGSKNPLNGYPHSGIIQLYKDNKPIEFLKPLDIDISFLENRSGKSPDFPFLLGRKDFFSYFYIAFYNTLHTSNMILVPRRDIVVYKN